MIGALSPSTQSLVEGLYPTASSRVRRDDARGRQDRPSQAEPERKTPVAQERSPKPQAEEPQQTAESEQDAFAPKGADGKPLTAEQQMQIRELQARDREVRAHEAAHKAAGGGLAGGASFTYQQGPDGKFYAVGGEVSIDMGGERDPRATIAKMRRVIAAALAPANPSGQDMAVAASANQALAEAQRQLNQQQLEERQQQTVEPKPEANRPGNQAQNAYGPPTAAPGSLLSLVA